MERKKRPVSVTVAACLVLLIGILTLILTLLPTSEWQEKVGAMASQVGVSSYVVTGWIIVKSVVRLICGVGMMLRQNWSRWLFLIFGCLVILLTGFVFGFENVNILNIVLYGILFWLLTTSQASEYFKPGISEPSISSE